MQRLDAEDRKIEKEKRGIHLIWHNSLLQWAMGE